MTQGKGSARRPHDVPTDTVADNWARTFGVATPQDVAPVSCQHFHTFSDHYATFAKGQGPVFRCARCGVVVP